MALNQPQDLAWMFVIAAAVIVTIGFGIASLEENQGLDEDTTFFDSINNKTTSATGLKGAADDQRSALAGEEGGSDQTSEEGFILRSFTAMRNLGKTFSIVEESFTEAGEEIGLDPIYWTLIISGILITFAVILYTWLRGS